MAMSRRSYGTGRLWARADKNGRETWYGSWHVGGRRVKRRIGPKRSHGASDGLTRVQAEAELRRRFHGGSNRPESNPSEPNRSLAHRGIRIQPGRP